MRYRAFAIGLVALGLTSGRGSSAADATRTAAGADGYYGTGTTGRIRREQTVVAVPLYPSRSIRPVLPVPLFPSRLIPINQDIDTYVRAEMARRRIPGLALAVIQHHRVQKMSAYGYASIELSVPVTPKTVFYVASISKSFTAVAVMMLVESGKLSLDDTLGKYLERLPPTWQSIQVRRLLSHTSGLPDIFVNPDVSLETVSDNAPGAIAALRDRPLDFKPGTSWKYNQTNYMLLALLVEKLSGHPFTQFCKSHLFAPLGLESPVFANSRVVVPHRATDYTVIDPTNQANPLMDHLEVLDYRMPSIGYPAGGLNISVTDFTRWLLALADGKLITKQSLEAMLTPARLTDGKMVDELDYPAPWSSYGLGMMLNPHGDHPQAGHMGGARASFAIFPKDDLAVIVLTNLQGAEPDSLLTGIASRYLSERQTSPTPTHRMREQR